MNITDWITGISTFFIFVATAVYAGFTIKTIKEIRMQNKLLIEKKQYEIFNDLELEWEKNYIYSYKKISNLFIKFEKLKGSEIKKTIGKEKIKEYNAQFLNIIYFFDNIRYLIKYSGIEL